LGASQSGETGGRDRSRRGRSSGCSRSRSRRGQGQGHGQAQGRRLGLRRNYSVFFIESLGYPLGFSLISAGTIMPLLLTELGASNLVVGLAPALGSLGVFVPGVFAAARLERLPLKKHVLITFSVIERLFLLAIAGVVLAWGQTRPSMAIWGFMVAWTLSNVAASIGLAAYFSMLSKCILPEVRGGLFGLAGALSGIIGLAVAEGAGVVLTEVAFPRNFALLFATASIVLLLSVLPLAAAREPADSPPINRRSSWEYLRHAAASARNNPSYRWAMIAIALLAVAMAANAFYSTYAVRVLGASTRTVGRFTAVAVGASALGMPFLGRMADRRGHKASLSFAAIFFAAAALLAAVVAGSAGGVGGVSGAGAAGAAAVADAAAEAQGLAAMFAVIFLANLGTSGMMVSQNLILSEFAPTPVEVPMYITYSWLLLSPVRAGAPVMSGYLSDTVGFGTAFRVTLAVSVAALVVLLLAVREPRHEQAGALKEAS
jgi:MFS family permease